MKIKKLFKWGLFSLGLFLWAPSVTLADEHAEQEEHEEFHEEEEEDEVPYPSQLETLRFLKEHMPIAVELLDRVKEDEGDGVYEEVLEELQEQYFHYLEIREYDGQEVASLRLAGMRIEMRMDRLLFQYHDEVETDEEREEIAEMVKALVREQLEHERRVAQIELKMLEAHKRELQAELKQLESMGDREIEERIRDLLELDGDE